MPDIRKINATYYDRPHAHPRRTDWRRVVEVIGSAIVIGFVGWGLLVLALTGLPS